MWTRKTFVQILMLFVMALGLAGTSISCNTVEGVGEDLEDAGDAIEDAAD